VPEDGAAGTTQRDREEIVRGLASCGDDWAQHMTEATLPTPHSPEPPPQPSGEALVPGWLDRLAAISWRILVTVAVVVVLAIVAGEMFIVTGSILVALVVAAVVYPLVQQLRDRGWPRARAAGAVSVLALVVVVVTMVLIVVAFAPYVVDVLRAIADGMATLSRELARSGLPDAVVFALNRAVDTARDSIVAQISSLVTPIANLITILIIGGFLTFYLLEDGDRAWAGATANLAGWRADQLTGQGLIALERAGGYLRGTAVLAAIDGITAWAFLVLLQVPFAGPLAIIVFVGGFVPYLGGVVTATILGIVAFGSQGAVTTAILLGLIALVNFLENRFVAPRAFGPTARVPASLAVVALLAGGALFGVLGLFAAVPIVTTVVAFAPAVVQSLGSMTKQSLDDALVPLWLDRLGQWSWRALVVLGLVWLVLQIAIVPFFSAPVVLAILVAPALAPVVRQLLARGLTRTRAVLLVIVATVVVISVVLYVTIASLGQSMGEIVDQAIVGAGNLGIGSAPPEIAESFGTGIADTVASVIAGAASTVIQLMVSVLLIFFLLRDGSLWWSRVLARVPANRRDRIDEVGLQATDIMRGTMTGTAIASFAGAVLQWVTMVILGLPLAFPISVLMFFAGFIPYVGSLIVTTLAFLIAVAVGDQTDVVLMAIFTIVFNLVQGNVVAPLVFGKTVSIHPAVVLLAAPAGAAIGGIMGMVLMVPILAIIKRTWRIVIHLFDPEYEQPPVATAARPAPTAAPARAALEGPAVGGAEL
jgi:predicted PurR-regulated permease PerM